jgi:hypothetical protein
MASLGKTPPYSEARHPSRRKNGELIGKYTCPGYGIIKAGNRHRISRAI